MNTANITAGGGKRLNFRESGPGPPLAGGLPRRGAFPSGGGGLPWPGALAPLNLDGGAPHLRRAYLVTFYNRKSIAEYLN